MKYTLLVVLILLTSGGRDAACEPRLEFPVEKVIGTFGSRRAVNLKLWPLTADRYAQTIVLRAPSRLQFHVKSTGRGSWKLTVSADDEVVWHIDGADAEEYFWTDVLTQKSITIVVQDATRSAEVELGIISERGAKNVPSTISHDPPQMYPILRESRAVQNRGRAIVLLELEKESGPAYCSGFLVSDELFVTAAHCIGTASDRQSAKVVFDYDGSATRGVALVKSIEYVSPALDVSICRLNGRSRNRAPLRVQGRAFALSQKLQIIHHADGDPKMITGADCKVITPSTAGASQSLTDVAHNCDTTGGSSGAPVFDADGSVVAVHHLGWDYDHNLLVNRAVKISDVVACLRGVNDDLLTELLRE